jgi:hypothetical protein
LTALIAKLEDPYVDDVPAFTCVVAAQSLLTFNASDVAEVRTALITVRLDMAHAIELAVEALDSAGLRTEGSVAPPEPGVSTTPPLGERAESSTGGQLLQGTSGAFGSSVQRAEEAAALEKWSGAVWIHAFLQKLDQEKCDYAPESLAPHVKSVAEQWTALALYSLCFPEAKPVFNAANKSLRVVAAGVAEDGSMTHDQALNIRSALDHFMRDVSAAISWLPRSVGTVTFRGISYLPSVKMNTQVKFTCLTSSSSRRRAADDFADRAMFVMQGDSGASISFASYFREEHEVLMPIGATFDVQSCTSATLSTVKFR